jgi:hypothetical protein
MVTARVVVTKKIDDRYVWLAKASPDFLAALPDSGKPPEYPDL